MSTQQQHLTNYPIQFLVLLFIILSNLIKNKTSSHSSTHPVSVHLDPLSNFSITNDIFLKNFCANLPHNNNNLWRRLCVFYPVLCRIHYESNAHFQGKIYLWILLEQMLKICFNGDVSVMSGRYPKTPLQEYPLRTL